MVAASFTLALALLCVQEGAAASRSAAAILRKYDAVRYPSMSDGNDAESLARFERQVLDAATRQQALALELATGHPEHERVDDVLGSRWTLFCTVNADGERVLSETDEWTKQLPRTDVAVAAAGARALAAITIEGLDFARRRELAEAALAVAPSATQVGVALTELAWKFTADPAQQCELLALVQERFAQDEDVLHGLKLVERLVARVGQPLTLDFTGVDGDRTEGAPKSLAEWRGRPCLVNARMFTPGWVGEHEKQAQVHFAALRSRWPARVLPALGFATVFDDAAAAEVFRQVSPTGDPVFWIDRATWESSILSQQLKISQEGVWMLVDAAGVLRAWSWSLAELGKQADRLLAPKRRSV